MSIFFNVGTNSRKIVAFSMIFNQFPANCKKNSKNFSKFLFSNDIRVFSTKEKI